MEKARNFIVVDADLLLALKESICYEYKSPEWECETINKIIDMGVSVEDFVRDKKEYFE